MSSRYLVLYTVIELVHYHPLYWLLCNQIFVSVKVGMISEVLFQYIQTYLGFFKVMKDLGYFFLGLHILSQPSRGKVLLE